MEVGPGVQTGLSPGELGEMAHFGGPLALPTPHAGLARCSLPVSAVSVESPGHAAAAAAAAGVGRPPARDAVPLPNCRSSHTFP